MSHFAKINTDGIVLCVIVAEQDFIDSGKVGEPKNWIQTSYNTRAGEHPQGRPLRKNYAGIGYSYDRVRDAFIAPQLYASWLLNERTCCWQAPVPMPADGQRYQWNEARRAWEVMARNVTAINTTL